jgi:hypothetical protein
MNIKKKFFKIKNHAKGKLKIAGGGEDLILKKSNNVLLLNACFF